ncbi:MAG: hypothetical protein H0W73_04955 [Bacteroidetes bacterium]|nr:hypothetical protein [Bacteroidota bacterium]
MSKTREFEVPASIIAEFASLMIDQNLSNEITGLNEEGELIIEVRYEAKNKAGLFTLIEFMDDYYGNNQEE